MPRYHPTRQHPNLLRDPSTYPAEGRARTSGRCSKFADDPSPPARPPGRTTPDTPGVLPRLLGGGGGSMFSGPRPAPLNPTAHPGVGHFFSTSQQQVEKERDGETNARPGRCLRNIVRISDEKRASLSLCSKRLSALETTFPVVKSSANQH